MTMHENENDVALNEPYRPCAVYFDDSDCIEYVKEDGFAVYERVDDFLTLIFDKTKIRLIGFKLKGFKCVFNEQLKPLYELNDQNFVEIVSVIEAVCSKVGDCLFADDYRSRAYKAAHKMAIDDNVKLSYEFVPTYIAAENIDNDVRI